MKVLRSQHEAGRTLTDIILREAADERFKKEEGRKAVVAACEVFIRKYRPHEAREGTVLFPALREVLPTTEHKELGEQFEKEDKLFGEGGFESALAGSVALAFLVPGRTRPRGVLACPSQRPPTAEGLP